MPHRRAIPWSDHPDAERYVPWWPAGLARPVPEESWRDIAGHRVHLDRLRGDRPTTVLLLHGGGGHGRLLLPFAVPLAEAGYDVIAPDLPHFGRTVPVPGAERRPVTFDTWIALVSTLVDDAHAEGREVVLYGLSLGGMTAYHVAAENRRVTRVIATTLLDLRRPQARAVAAANRFVSGIVGPLALRFPSLGDPIPMKASWVGRLAAMSPDEDLVEALRTDPAIGEVRMPGAFWRTLQTRAPAVEPEAFDRPVLLAHPGADRWTPLAESKPFFDRLAGPKQLVALPGGAHAPLEAQAFAALRDAVLAFLP